MILGVLKAWTYILLHIHQDNAVGATDICP